MTTEEKYESLRERYNKVLEELCDTKNMLFAFESTVEDLLDILHKEIPETGEKVKHILEANRCPQCEGKTRKDYHCNHCDKE